MPSLLARLLRHPARGVTALVLLAAAPKCVVCVAAYVGLGAMLGLGGPEFCGDATGPRLAWTTALAWCGAVGGLGTTIMFVLTRLRRHPADIRERTRKPRRTASTHTR